MTLKDFDWMIPKQDKRTYTVMTWKCDTEQQQEIAEKFLSQPGWKLHEAGQLKDGSWVLGYARLFKQ